VDREPEVDVAVEFVVGEFHVRPSERRVYHAGLTVPLGSRAFDLLLALIDQRDRVVAKDELLALVWPGVVVEEANLAVQVSGLRKLLGNEVIATVPGRGYRFTGPVNELPSGSERLMSPTREAPPAEPACGWVPAALTQLLGRDRALAEIRPVLHASRCLTLTGAGGSGKTRLALALADALRGHYPGGVWWIELDKLSDPRGLVAKIAQTLGAADPQKPALHSLLDRLKGRRALLVLDNCEHLVDDCAALAVQLLRELPQLQLLATSRESLRVAGEAVWCVPPLDVPDVATDGSVEALMRHASVQLLLARIQQRNPGFAFTQDQCASIAQLCRRLDGLPLAIELAAAQVGPQSLAQVASRLDRSLQLLNVGARGGLPHHQTMTAAVDWGYRLLSDDQRALFMRLSVLVGGATHEAAAAACQDLGLHPDAVADLLGGLERVSMVQSMEAQGAVRFRMLEPIRQFAFAKLESLGLTDPVMQQVLGWFVDHCKGIAVQLTGPLQARGYQCLAEEFDNLRALLSWSKQGNLELGLLLAADLWRFWQVKGHAKELLDWFEETLPLAAEVPRPVQADACNAAGVMARTVGRYPDAIRLHQRALEMQRELGHRRGEAIALNNLCVVARDQHDHPLVVQFGQASLRMAREIGDRNLEGLALMHLGTAQRGQGQPAAAEASYLLSVEIFTELGESNVLATLSNFLGSLAQADGRWAEAQRCFERSLQLNEGLGNHWGLAISTCNLAALRNALGDHTGALPLLKRSFSEYQRAGVKHGLDECFGLLAQIAQSQGRFERAAWCWGVLGQLERDIGVVVAEGQRAAREQVQADLRAQMQGLPFDAAKAAGQRASLPDALREVQASDGLH